MLSEFQRRRSRALKGKCRLTLHCAIKKGVGGAQPLRCQKTKAKALDFTSSFKYLTEMSMCDIPLRFQFGQ